MYRVDDLLAESVYTFLAGQLDFQEDRRADFVVRWVECAPDEFRWPLPECKVGSSAWFLATPERMIVGYVEPPPGTGQQYNYQSVSGMVNTDLKKIVDLESKAHA